MTLQYRSKVKYMCSILYCYIHHLRLRLWLWHCCGIALWAIQERRRCDSGVAVAVAVCKWALTHLEWCPPGWWPRSADPEQTVEDCHSGPAIQINQWRAYNSKYTLCVIWCTNVSYGNLQWRWFWRLLLERTARHWLPPSKCNWTETIQLLSIYNKWISVSSKWFH